MDIETEPRYSNKRGGYQRPGPSSASQSSRVCFHWRAGRCNRHPCPFLHSELPPFDGPAATPLKRAHHQIAALVGDERGFHPKGLVWRNPNTANPGPPSKWGKGRGAGGPGPAAAGKVADRVCRYFLAGKCSYGDGCRFLHSWFVGDSFSLLTPLQGHQKVITGIALPMGSDKLYSGSKDETLRAWNCQTGQCEGVLNLGGEVGCMISEGPWIFVGIPHFVKGWNTQLNTDVSLPGPSGQVYALVVGNNLLFAGVHDGQILSWKFSAAMNSFEPVTSLSGHRLAVVTMVVGANRLYSGSMDHTIKVWDLTSLQCIQTLNDHTNVVMSLLCWDQFLLSCSLDQTIKVWVATESGNLEVTYTHNEEQGVLTLCGMPDAQGKPVLFCSCNDNSICLYDLPSFGERGKIFSKEEVRAIQVGPDGLFFTGDGTGELKVWKWLNEMPAA